MHVLFICFSDLQLSDDQLKNYALAEIEKILRSNGCTLKRFADMPFPDYGVMCDVYNRLLHEELNYDRASLFVEHKQLLSCLTDEQKVVYQKIMEAVSKGEGGIFFLYGYGGTGKTFIWRTLTAALRSQGEIVLNVASSGIASLLLSGGRTAHARFAIPININEDSICGIRQGSDLAVLLERTKLIIWDEAPMAHKHCFEALDRTCRDVLRSSNPRSLEQPFGGKVIVFGGDFRQILPVVPKGSRQDIISSTINSSYLWNYCEVLKLTKNMRLQTGGSTSDMQETKSFSDWILKVGDGNLGESNDGEALIEIPDDLLIKDVSDPLDSIISYTYPYLTENLWNPKYLQERSILAPTHDDVDIVNEHLLSIIPGEEKVYLSSDSICKSDMIADTQDDIYPPEYLNSVRISGLPNHKLKVKVGVPVMLLRNIDQQSGLCNGTRLQVCQLGNHVIEAKILSGNNIGQKVFIPRILMCPSDVRLPFKMQRRQFPIDVCFAMTINKSQGQSLSHVGLYLPRSVFSHGQLYVAISRVTQKAGLKILICDHEGHTSNTTTNVVYKEVFRNI